MRMDKAAFKDALVSHLRERLEVTQSSLRAAAEAADEQHEKRRRDEDEGPTSAFLAAGQAQRFRALRDELAIIDRQQLRDYGRDDPIDIGAIVDVEDEEGEGRTLLVMPGGAGVELEVNDVFLTVVTPRSPLGKAITGKRSGDEFDLTLGGEARNYEIVDVQ